MQALDLDANRRISERRNRLEVVQGVVEDFVKKRENDQIGLVVFGAEAFTQCPLTLDHGIVATFMERLEIGMAGDATAIGSALGTAVKRLKDSEAESKVIILLTDGVNNQGAIDPLQAADLAASHDIRVYAIGAGRTGQAPMPMKTSDGRTVLRRVMVELDEKTLQKIAATSGGRYFHAASADGLREVYREIDHLERTQITEIRYLQYSEHYDVWVAGSLACIGLAALLGSTYLRRFP